jgi:hypothetical protein
LGVATSAGDSSSNRLSSIGWRWVFDFNAVFSITNGDEFSDKFSSLNGLNALLRLGNINKKKRKTKNPLKNKL